MPTFRTARRPRVLDAALASICLASACCAGGATSTEPAPGASQVDEAPATEGSAEPAQVVVDEPAPEPVPELPSCFIGVPDGSGGCIVTPADRRAAMTAEHRWDHVMSSCPDPLLGSFAEAWVWEAPESEAALVAHDLAGDGTTFDLLADYEGTSIIVRVRDAASGDSIGVIKTTSSNTRVGAEVYAWRLANFLGFGELVPPVLPVEMGEGALRKMRDLLAGITYDDEWKETNRQRVVRDLDDAIDDGTAFFGAYKPWLRAFMFHGGLGDRERLAGQPVMDHLAARGEQPGSDEVTLAQYTRLYSPRGTHRGTIVMWQLAEDLSNMLLMDALMGQNDRFAGANLHFRAVDGTEDEVGERNGAPVFDMGEVRLLALDNGAALRGRNGSGIADLQGNIVGGTRVERFDPVSVERVRALGRRALGHGCETPPFDDEVDAIWAYLGIEGDEVERATGYLENTLTYLDELEARHGDDMLLAPRPDADGETVIEGDDLGLDEE